MSLLPSEASPSGLSICAQEPIHLPGAIQPHGCLITFDLQTLQVAQVSANVEAFTGRPPSECLGSPITSLLAPIDAQMLLSTLASDAEDADSPILLAARQLTGVLHRQRGLGVLELEPDRIPRPGWQADVDRAMLLLLAAPDSAQLLSATAHTVRRLLTIDRVVIYQFSADGSGEVIAESCAAHMQPYLGLHFPESDVPQQARALYLRHWVRAIPDARYVPVPLVPALRPDSGEALDLGHAMLRSISPMHLAYLAAMQVQASLSVSLIVSGRLWGLISCGHQRPLPLPYATQHVGELLGRLVSLKIGALQAGEFRSRQLGKSASMERLVAAMRSAGPQVLEGLADEPALMLNLCQADGAAILFGNTALCVGRCPSDVVVRELAEWSSQRSDAAGMFATRQLGTDDVRWTLCGPTMEVVGVLAIFIPAPVMACVMWFRPEQIASVTWGGKPHDIDALQEPVAPSPSRSFEAWKEQVRGQSLVWDDVELDAAANLRRFAIELDLARQVRKATQAIQARDDLVAVVSHDLRNPMSVVALQAAVIQRLIAQDPTELSQRLRMSAQTIQRAADRMNSLLQDLLDLAKIEAGRFEVALVEQRASQLVEETCELLQSLAEAKNMSLVSSALPSNAIVRVDPERIFQVLSNLIGNAVKFSSAGGHVTVGAKVVGASCEFSVSDDGAGIAPEQLNRIFDRYWQAKPSDVAGAGLGLYIAKGIVESHGGSIRAQSEFGQGTTILFTIPLAAGDSSSERPLADLQECL